MIDWTEYHLWGESRRSPAKCAVALRYKRTPQVSRKVRGRLRYSGAISGPGVLVGHADANFPIPDYFGDAVSLLPVDLACLR